MAQSNSTVYSILNAYTRTKLGGPDGELGTIDDDVLVPNYTLGFDHSWLNKLDDVSLYTCDFSNFWNQIPGNPEFVVDHEGVPNGDPSKESRGNESAIVKQGFALSKCIQAVLDATGSEKVILFGHSMGGLAAREYLQRRNPRWWVYPDEADGHRVAKLITFGTPHLGSNFLEWPDLLDISHKRAMDRHTLNSEAVRDLRWSYDLFGQTQGVYLFGGAENDETLLTQNFHNTDINADGDELDWISGISDGTKDYSLLPLPPDMEYTWITSNCLFLDHPIKCTSYGDWAVDLDRQWLHDGPNDTPAPIGLADTLLTDKIHTDEPKDIRSILRGLDEPDMIERSYEVQIAEPISGVITFQPNGFEIDADFFWVEVPSAGYLTVTVEGPQSGVTSVTLYRDQFYNLGSMIDFDNAQSFPSVVEGDVEEGPVFVRVEGIATGTTWQSHYRVTVSLDSNTPDLIPENLVLSHDTATPGAELSVNFTISNEGEAESQESTTRLRISSSALHVTDQDPELTAFTTPVIQSGESFENTVVVDIPTGMSPGQYYVWVIVDVNSEAGQTIENEKNDRINAPVTVLSGTFQLDFPLADYTPTDAPISSAFDHSMTKPYCPDEIVVPFSGEVGSVLSSVEDPGPASNSCTGGTLLYSYQKTDRTPFLSDFNYTGTQASGSTVINYDGHPGLDYAVAYQDVFAAAAGQVVTIDAIGNSAAGKYIKIQHPEGYQTLYMHLDQVAVGEDDSITSGQQIGVSGATGGVSPHLHFEVRKLVSGEWKPVDPYGWKGSAGLDPYAIRNDYLWGDSAPTISSVSPNPVFGSSDTQPLTVNGFGFESGAKVILRDKTTQESYEDVVSANSYTVVLIGHIFPARNATWTVEVQNPNGQSTGEFEFEVVGNNSSAPVITKVDPNPVIGSSSVQSLTIFVSGLQPGATVTLHDLRTDTEYSGHEIDSSPGASITVEHVFGTVAASWTVEVANPDGQRSVAFPFSVTSSPGTVDDLVISDGIRFLSAPPYYVNAYTEVTATILNNSSKSVSLKRVQVDGLFTRLDDGWEFTRNWKAVDLNPPVVLPPEGEYVYRADNSGDVFPGIPAPGTAVVKVVVSGNPDLATLANALPNATASLAFDVVSVPRNFEIRTDVIPALSGTTEGAGPYLEGTTVTLRAIPSAGFVFSKWIRHLDIFASDSQEYSFPAAFTGLMFAHFISTPEIVSPANDATRVSSYPTFYWTGGGSWESFEFQLATDAAFTENRVDVTDIVDLQHTEISLESNRSYFWRARSAGISSHSEWSDATHFVTARASSELVQSPQKISDLEGGFEGVLKDGDFFGHSVSNLGDVDGDGINDLAVGAPRDDNGLPGPYERGAVWILFLHSNGTVKSYRKISSADGGFQGAINHQDLFGSAVAGLGDLDQDGIPDVGIGAPGNGGAIWILFLNQDGSVKSHQKINNDEGGLVVEVSGSFGTSLAVAGDIDKDGIVDLLVGTYSARTVWILLMNRNGTTRSQQVIGESKGGFTGQTSGLFGYSVAGLGENQGRATIGIGVPDNRDGGTLKGAIWVLSLNANGTVFSQNKISNAPGGVSGVSNLWEFGHSMARTGDLNSDGVEDLIVGTGNYASEGAAFILLLTETNSLLSNYEVADENGEFGHYFGSGVAGVGDLDGDGVVEIISGEPSSDDGGADRGAIWVIRTASEHKEASPPSVSITDSPQNVSYDGGLLMGSVNASGSSTVYYFEYGMTDAYGYSTVEADAGEGESSVSVSSQIYGLTPGTSYHFRLVARSVAGISESDDHVFSTPVMPPDSGHKLIASDGEMDDHFGYAVAASGDRVLVTKYGTPGAAYIYSRSGQEWAEEAILWSLSTTPDHFGDAADLEGSRAIIGAWLDDEKGSQAGAAYVFHRDGSEWTNRGKLVASDGSINDQFGSAVGLDGDVAVVGSPGFNDWSGAVYVFGWDGTSWKEQSKLNPGGHVGLSSFGRVIALDADVIAVGVPNDGEAAAWAGAVYVFRRDGGTWEFEQKLMADDAQVGDNFGVDISVDGDVILIGADQDDSNGTGSGAAYVFRNFGRAWIQEAKLSPTEADEGDSFGSSVAIRGSTALIGARYHDGAVSRSGSAFLFRYTRSSWEEEAEIIAPDGADGDNYGSAVAIGDTFLLVGALGDKVGADWAQGSAWIKPLSIHQSTVSATLAAGWNLVGIPFSDEAVDYRSAYPGALDGTLFSFTGSYVQPNNGLMTAGNGYWLRFPSSTTQSLEGIETTSLSIDLAAGWNLISPPNCTLSTVSIVDSENIVLGGTIFGFVGSYTPVTEVVAGSGYWIRTNAAGTIGLDCSAGKGGVSNSAPLGSLAGVSINNQMVYLATTNFAPSRSGAYSLPPLAPGQAWQAAFADGRYVAETAGAVSLIGASRPIAVSGEGVTAIVRSSNGKALESIRLSATRSLAITDPQAAKLELTIADLPPDFALYPAYPTPFNPQTTIGFALPEDVDVSLSVYDILGRLVARIVDLQATPAGHHEVVFDASRLASGVYIVQLSAGRHVAIRKLVLQK